MKTTDYTERDLNRKRPRANISLETCMDAALRDIQISVLYSGLVGPDVT